MNRFDELAAMGPQDIWDGVAVRAVHGERITLGVVELEPNSIVPEHNHENEQLGMVLSGSLRFRIGDESRELGPGGTWCIPANTPHEVVAGGRRRDRCLRADARGLVEVQAAGSADAALAVAGYPRANKPSESRFSIRRRRSARSRSTRASASCCTRRSISA